MNKGGIFEKKMSAFSFFKLSSSFIFSESFGDAVITIIGFFRRLFSFISKLRSAPRSFFERVITFLPIFIFSVFNVIMPFFSSDKSAKKVHKRAFSQHLLSAANL